MKEVFFAFLVPPWYSTQPTAIYDLRFIVGLIASVSRHLVPQHEGCNIGVSP